MQRHLAYGMIALLSPLTATGQVSLLHSEAERQPIIQASANPNVTNVVPRSGSLFIGTSGTSLLAPYPERERNHPAIVEPPTPRGSDRIVALRSLIADAEAGPLGYDAVQYGARIKPSKPPTQMTLAEIYAWINATPGQPHAIGRYQFIPSTLRALVNELGLDLDTRFSPAVQDQLSDLLLLDAGLAEFTAGQITRHKFMNNLAKIWAGLPNSTGRSHYHGYAGNHATISWGKFDQEMARIFAS